MAKATGPVLIANNLFTVVRLVFVLTPLAAPVLTCSNNLFTSAQIISITMQSNLITILTVLLTLSVFSVRQGLANPYEPGETVAAFTAQDQHGQTFALEPATTRYLLVSHDMETGKKANTVLTALGKDYLPGKKAVYVANIYGMPGIGRFFAIPKMKSYAHRIVLGDDAGLIARFPQQPGKVTILALSGGKVQSIAYWAPGAEGLDTHLK